MNLALAIDDRAHAIAAQWLPTMPPGTVDRLQAMTTQTYRPQDSRELEAIAAEIWSWVKAVDDIFSPKPLYLPDRCPHCNQSHARRRSDDGETLIVPALSVTVGRGAICNSCHAEWGPDRLMFLGSLLGYRVPGVIHEAGSPAS